MYMYCLDVANLLLPALYHVQLEEEGKDWVPFPIVLQFGDLKHSHEYRFLSLPHIKKFRIAASSKQLRDVTSNNNRNCYAGPRKALIDDTYLQPIVWKLATRRHYGLVHQVGSKDRMWEQKRDMAVFRGQLTGSRDGYDKALSDEENCRNLRRCRLVYNHANSTLVNARLTDTRKRLPDVLNGVELTTGSVTVRHLLRYKGIVMLEGNDVASGLKWALLSESVVLMPIPRHTSWAMEELLEPWVHYVPLNHDITDVEEKMRWILDHDADARRISHAATLWMQDLVFHPDAESDDRWIQQEILRRYRRHFLMAASEESS
jgi:Glycosyl transferase family 90